MSADTQIKSFFQRWERLEGEKKAISDDLKELFSEAKHAGYDSKALRAAFNRKVKQDAETTADQQFDMVVDTYLDAINGVARDARMRARENIEEFDPITGEFLEDNITIIDRDDEDGNHLTVTVDARIAAILASNAPERPSTNDEPSPEAGPQAEASPAGTGAGTLADREGRFKGEAASVGLPANSEIDPNEDREEGHSLDGNADANAGGGHVNAQNEAAHQAGALVKPAPASKPLRPLCKRPDNCDGYGSVHCASCLRAAKQADEVAA